MYFLCADRAGFEFFKMVQYDFLPFTQPKKSLKMFKTYFMKNCKFGKKIVKKVACK